MRKSVTYDRRHCSIVTRKVRQARQELRENQEKRKMQMVELWQGRWADHIKIILQPNYVHFNPKQRIIPIRPDLIMRRKPKGSDSLTRRKPMFRLSG